MSAAWDHEPDLEGPTHWLRGCLPENGARDPYEERTLALKIRCGEPPLISGPVETAVGVETGQSADAR